MTMANTIRGLLPDGTAPTPLHDQILSIAQENGTPPGTVPIFATLLEALAWEEANPGRVALTIESQEPDTEPPTSAGILTVEAGDVYARLSVTGAVDDRGITGYSFRVDSGEWSEWSVSPQHTAIGLERSTSYTFQHRVRDAGEHVLEGAGVTVETLAAAPLEPGDVITSDDFTGDGTGARTTTAYTGGTPMPYTGTVTTSGGILTLASSDLAAHLTATLPFERQDLQVDFRLVALPSTATCQFDLRKGSKSTGFEFNSGGSFRARTDNPSAWESISGVSAVAGHDYRAALVGAFLTLNDITADTSGSTEVTALGSGGFGVMLRNGGAIDNLVVTAL